MKKISIVLLALLVLVSIASCGKEKQAEAVVETATKVVEQATTVVETAAKAVEEVKTVVETPAAAVETAKEPEVVYTYERASDEDVYEAVLGEYEALVAAAKAAESNDERFVLYAQAEAYLLDSAVMIPTTTQNGAYTISRIAPRTVPYVQWGNDEDRLKGLVISADSFLTPAEREELLTQWAAAVKGEGKYDPAAYLKAQGHTIATEYKTTFSTGPVTLDTLNTSSQSDTEILVNTTDNLVEYNNLSQLTPALAESWSISEDGLVYTFNIRQGAYWYTSEGRRYKECCADDFVAGFQHMLDTQAGLEWLVEGVVAGVSEYLYEGGSFDNVGYKAVDKYTLQITLCAPTSYFMTMLTYSCFSPICRQFYVAEGGVFGIEEYAAASTAGTIKYGDVTNVASQVYNGAFLLTKYVADSEIVLTKNPGYYKASEVTLNKITWVYDNGENMDQFYKDVCDGVYAGTGLTAASGTLAKAQADGNFEKYAYISETTSTTYFGGLNLNRGTYALSSGAVASNQTEKQKIDTHTALMNKNFRKALMTGFDRITWNAVSRGEDLAATNLRNMYTHPEFVTLSADTTDSEGHTFVAGTYYGEMVQYYLDKMGAGITVADQCDGWYNLEAARAYLEAAKAELGDSVDWPINIDVVYYSASSANTAQAQAYKQVIENSLGSENVQVNLIEATTSSDYYAGGYRASSGEAGNFDMFYGSGWGPDYGDPSTYLDTFLGYGAGYMTKVIGLF